MTTLTIRPLSPWQPIVARNYSDKSPVFSTQSAILLILLCFIHHRAVARSIQSLFLLRFLRQYTTCFDCSPNQRGYSKVEANGTKWDKMGMGSFGCCSPAPIPGRWMTRADWPFPNECAHTQQPLDIVCHAGSGSEFVDLHGGRPGKTGRKTRSGPGNGCGSQIVSPALFCPDRGRRSG